MRIRENDPRGNQTSVWGVTPVAPVTPVTVHWLERITQALHLYASGQKLLARWVRRISPLHGTVSRNCVVGALFLLVQHLVLAPGRKVPSVQVVTHSFLTEQLFMSMEDI